MLAPLRVRTRPGMAWGNVSWAALRASSWDVTEVLRPLLDANASALRGANPCNPLDQSAIEGGRKSI